MQKYICDMLESLLYKYSPCRIYCSFFGCFCPLEFEKFVYYQWEIFCSIETKKNCWKKTTGSHPLWAHSTCFAGLVLFCLHMNMFCSLHFINSIEKFRSLASSTLIEMMDTIPLHRSIHWLTPPFLLAVDVRWICADLDFVYKYLHTCIS